MTEDFDCEECTGVLVFDFIDKQGYANYHCVHCAHTERIKVEVPLVPAVQQRQDVDHRPAL